MKYLGFNLKKFPLPLDLKGFARLHVDYPECTALAIPIAFALGIAIYRIVDLSLNDPWISFGKTYYEPTWRDGIEYAKFEDFDPKIHSK